MNSKSKGQLIIIGGAEEKHRESQMGILEEVSRHAVKGNGTLLVVTVATQLPEELAAEYRKVFGDLGVPRVEVLDIRTRQDGQEKENIAKLKRADVIFFTGGDQLRITSQVGDSQVFQCIQEKFHKGTLVAGTSAGAAAMPQTMLIDGASDESNRIRTIGMAPGLGLIDGVVIDSHFAQRGRLGRLLGAVSQNPKNLGLGIDEDTAVYVQNNQEYFEVLGSGAVYVIDGSSITFSSLSDKNAEEVLSLYDVKLHVLSRGDCFDLVKRQPTYAIIEEKDSQKSPVAKSA
jgi:cyanophycinase